MSSKQLILKRIELLETLLAELKADVEAGFYAGAADSLYGRFPDLPDADDADFQDAKKIWNPRVSDLTA